MFDLADTGEITNLAQRKRPFGSSTRSVHGQVDGRQPRPHHALATPIMQTAAYTFQDTADLVAFKEAKMRGEHGDRRGYGRYGNPTVRVVEKRIATLENGDDAILFPSGMNAITHVLLSILPTGSHVIFTDDCYVKTRQFGNEFLKRLGIESASVPMGDAAALEAAIQPNTRIIVSESPTNPNLRIVDLEQLTAIAQKHGLKTMIDATFATPINQKPLDWGIDLVVHSATKYFSGNNDVLAGVVVGQAELIGALRQSQGVLGGVLDPNAAFLLERGLKTLALRVTQQNKTAQAAAEFLESHPKIERVWYPGLPSHPDYDIAQKQMSGFGGVVSFEVASNPGQSPLDAASHLIDALTIPYLAPSLGGVESLVMQPAIMSYYELSAEERLTIGIKDNLVRFAIGIEDTADILADLKQALRF